MFIPANKNRVFEDIINQIQEQVFCGTLKAGDKLPAERTMTEMFSVGRGTLREAIRVLEQKGLIEVRLGSGGGAFVRQVSGAQMSDNLDLLVRLQLVSLEHLAEFREEVESAVTEIAVSHATAEDVVALKEVLARAARLVDRGVDIWNDFLAVDNEFHMAIAKIAANPLFTVTLKSVHDHILPYYQQFLPPNLDFVHRMFEDLAAITQAFEQKNSKVAHTRALEHVCWFNEVMKENRNKQKELKG